MLHAEVYALKKHEICDKKAARSNLLLLMVNINILMLL